MKFFILYDGDKAIYINVAQIVKVESDPAGKSLTVRMVDGSTYVVTGDIMKALRALLIQLTEEK